MCIVCSTPERIKQFGLKSGDGSITVVEKGDAVRNNTISHVKFSRRLGSCLLKCWIWNGFRDGNFPVQVAMEDVEGFQQEGHQGGQEG